MAVISQYHVSYLNDGAGEPCTGQTRLQGWDCSGDRLGSIKLDLLGAELPMGSSENKVRCQLQFYLNVGMANLPYGLQTRM